MRRIVAVLLVIGLWAPALAEKSKDKNKKKSHAELSPLDVYVREASGRETAGGAATAGSLWSLP